MPTEKQEIWETPRKIALLAVAMAVIFSVVGYALGYQLGRQPSQPASYSLMLPPGTVITIPAAKP